MSSSNKNPKWWQLYLVFPLCLALFAVDNRLKISTRGHQAVQLGIIVIIFGLTQLWLKANAGALSGTGTFKVTRIHSYQLTELDEEYHPMFHYSEIKGVLGNTFEMDYIDAESFPVEEVSQELNKE